MSKAKLNKMTPRKSLTHVLSLILAMTTMIPELSWSAEASCAPPLAGPTIRWIAFVCEMRNGTDDFFNDDVQKCFSKLFEKNHVKSEPVENCKLNKKLKSEVCKWQAKYGGDSDTKICMELIESIPQLVLTGIGG